MSESGVRRSDNTGFDPGKFSGKRIAVWGDFILDEYIYTSTGRISREAPVLVTEYEESRFRLGGAGNVVQNIRSLGGLPVPVGFTGSDEAAENVRKIFSELDVVSDHLCVIEDFRTPKKTRILSGRDNSMKQQVLRIDYLNLNPPGIDDYRRLGNVLKKVLAHCDFLIVSDYLKESVTPGAFNSIIPEFPGLLSAVDSRENLLRFRGASVVTPNEPEIRSLFPNLRFRTTDDYLSAGNELMAGMDCKGIVQKRGHKGMIVFEPGHAPLEIPIHGSADIVDVTGAGDTVISVLGLSLASGMNLADAARLANIGASVVVMKEGAYPLRAEELAAETGTLSF